jgi:hypothetical protein
LLLPFTSSHTTFVGVLYALYITCQTPEDQGKGSTKKKSKHVLQRLLCTRNALCRIVKTVHRIDRRCYLKSRRSSRYRTIKSRLVIIASPSIRQPQPSANTVSARTRWHVGWHIPGGDFGFDAGGLDGENDEVVHCYLGYVGDGERATCY